MSNYEHGKIYWQCRRGMWELDLFLIPFFRDQYSCLSPELKQQFEKLLSFPDPELYAWLHGNQKVVSELTEIIAAVKEYSLVSDKTTIF